MKYVLYVEADKPQDNLKIGDLDLQEAIDYASKCLSQGYRLISICKTTERIEKDSGKASEL